MNEYLPSITVQKGFFSNNYLNHRRYLSFGNDKKNLYQINQNYSVKQKQDNIFNPNNYLVVSNTKKDEVNSNKNTTSITYYNRGFSDKKINNNKNSFMPETFYNNQKKDTKYKLDNILFKSYNKSKLIPGINNNKITYLRNIHLLLPEVQTDNKKNKINKASSLPISNKENNSNNMNATNHFISIKQIKNINKENSKKNILSHEKIDCQNIHVLKGKDNLTSIGFLDNKKKNYNIFKDKSFSERKTVSSDIKFEKEKEKEKKKSLNVLYTNIKTIKSFSHINNINLDLNNNLNNLKSKIQNNNINIKNNNIKVCPLCHKEKEIYKYPYHLSLHPSKIFDWLFLGSYRNACDKQGIKDLGINYVLNCAIECQESFGPDVKYCHLKLNDSPTFRILKYLDKASSFINQAKCNNGIILVHCQLGISRSTACVISYFIKYLGYTTMGALNFIKKKRTQVMPNFGFLNQLMTYEKNNLGVEKKSD